MKQFLLLNSIVVFCASISTLFAQCPPVLQASSLIVANAEPSTASLQWVRGSGQGVIVLAKANGSVDGLPANGTTYNANPAIGSGDQIGTGNRVVYSGSGTSVTVTGLLSNINYFFSVFEFSGSPASCYQTSAPATAFVYCRPSTGNGGKITNVTVTRSSNSQIVLNNSNSIQNTGNYQNLFGLQAAALTPGSTYSFSITREGSGLRRCNVLIDYDSDAVFTLGAQNATSETIYNLASNLNTITFEYTTPVNATPGIKALRIRSFAQNTALSICLNSAVAGETEDYLLQIGEPPECYVDANPSSTELCSGGSSTITVSGSDAYIWTPAAGLSCTNCADPVASPEETTTYQVIGSSGSCSDTTTVTIQVNHPEVTIQTSDSLLCAGEPKQLNVEPDFSAYTWSTGSNTTQTTVSVAGTYSVTITDENGCSANDSILISESPDALAGFEWQETIAGSRVIDFTNTSEHTSTYNWDFGMGNFSAEENPQFTFPGAGVFEVQLIAGNTCGSDTTVVNVTIIEPDMISDIFVSHLPVFPNPFHTIFEIQVPPERNKNLSVSIYDFQGRLIQSETIQYVSQRVKISTLSNHPNGLYFLKIDWSNGSVTRKIIKE